MWTQIHLLWFCHSVQGFLHPDSLLLQLAFLPYLAHHLVSWIKVISDWEPQWKHLQGGRSVQRLTFFSFSFWEIRSPVCTYRQSQASYGPLVAIFFPNIRYHRSPKMLENSPHPKDCWGFWGDFPQTCSFRQCCVIALFPQIPDVTVVIDAKHQRKVPKWLKKYVKLVASEM